jgi:hypothetical protein
MKMCFPTVWGCFVDLPVLLGKLVPKTDWKKLEKDNDPKLLQKGIFVNSARTDSLVTSVT